MFENPTVNLSAHCNSCGKISCFSSQFIFTFLNAGKQFVSCVHFCVCVCVCVNFALHPIPQTNIWLLRKQGGWTLCCRVEQLYLSSHSEVVTCSCFLTKTDSTISQHIDLFLWITLYMRGVLLSVTLHAVSNEIYLQPGEVGVRVLVCY